LPDAGRWDTLNASRRAMLPNLFNPHAAQRYRAMA
jgi:uncharacterized protein